MSQNYGSIALHKLLKEHFNLDEFISGQEEVITNILSGKNVLAVFPKKNDRSICYKLPAIVLDGITIVISRYMNEPTIDLLPTTYLDASLENRIFQKRIYEIINGKYKLIYISPEQLRNRSFIFALRKIPLSLLVIDDAEQMSLYGYNFNANYQYVLNAISDLDSQPKILAFASVCTEKIRYDIMKIFDFESMKLIIPELSYPDIFLGVIPATSEMEKLDKLSAIISKLKGYGIIFVNSRNTAKNVLNHLKNIEPAISVYQGGMSKEDHRKIIESFHSKKIKILIVTSYSNIKIESDVDYIIHFDMPDCLDRYYDHICLSGQFSGCILIYSPFDKNFHHSIIETGSTLRSDIWRVIDMIKRNDKNISEKKNKAGMKTFDVDDWLYEHLNRLDHPSKKELLRLRNIYENLNETDKNPLSLSEYNQYLESEHWRGFAKSLFDEQKQCSICGNKAEHIHHLHYRNIWKENIEDVVVLCAKCHCFIHPDGPMTKKIFNEIVEIERKQMKLTDDESQQIIIIPYNQIESETGINVNRFHNAINIMQNAGMIEILPDCSINAKVKVHRSRNELLVCSEDNIGRSLIEWLFRESESNQNDYFNVNLLSLSKELKCSIDVLENSFLTLSFAGCISFITTLKGVMIRLIDLDVSLSDEVFERIKGIKYGSLRLMEDYIKTDECRWKFLYNYVLSDINENCGKCDNCLSDQRVIPMEINKMIYIYEYKSNNDIATAILNCAEKTDGLISRKDMAKLLAGQITRKIQKYGFDHIEEFGCLSNMDRKDIMKHIDELIERGCLQVSSLFFPMIYLTDIGRRRLLSRH